MDYSRLTGFRGRGGGRGGFSGAGMSSRIPDGGRTPMGVAQGGRTPAWGVASGSRSKSSDSPPSFLLLTSSAPAHGSSSARTPAWQSSGMSGGRTPAYGGGGGATVNPYADGSRTAYGGFAGGVSHLFHCGSIARGICIDMFKADTRLGPFISNIIWGLYERSVLSTHTSIRTFFSDTSSHQRSLFILPATVIECGIK